MATTYKEFCSNQEIEFNIKKMVKEMEHYKNIISTLGEELLYYKVDMTIVMVSKAFPFEVQYEFNITNRLIYNAMK